MPRNLAAIVPPEARMDGERICEICTRNDVFKDGSNPPSRAGYERLATWVDMLWVDARQVDAGRRRLARNILEIGKTGLDLWDELLDEMSRPSENLLAGTSRIEGDIAALKQLFAAMEAVQSREYFQARPLLSTPRKRKGEKWKKYASTLAALLIEEMIATNPGKKFGFGDDSPVSRFVAALIPFITRESHPAATFARHFQREIKAYGFLNTFDASVARKKALPSS